MINFLTLARKLNFLTSNEVSKVYISNWLGNFFFMSGRSFEFYNNLGRFNFKITTQKSGRWNKPVIVITVVTT
jgi:hypothetical protein